MKYPDAVTRLRATASDAYGNPGASWESPSSLSLKVFLIEKISTTVNGASLNLSALAPASADVETGDRLVIRGVTYLATSATISSPSKAVLKTIVLSALPGSS